MKKKRLSIIIPLYNEHPSSYLWVASKLSRSDTEVIIVDDGSDNPVELGEYKTLGIRLIRREKNKGYGNAIKFGSRFAHGNYIGIIDADKQYDPNDLLDLWEALEDEDMLIGKRITHEGGIRRYLGRVFIKCIASFIALRYIPDLNSGVRIFKRNLARQYGSLLCDEFSYTTSMTLCFLLDKYKVKWMPIGFYPRQGSPSTVRMVRHGLITLYQILYIGIGLRTRKVRQWLR